MLVIFAVLTMVHLEADIDAAGGDYVLVPFDVPANTVEIEIAHGDGSADVILDWGVWGPDGFRGWPGGLSDNAIIGVDESSRGYLEGPITPGTWTLVIGKAKLPQGTAHYVVDITCRDNATLTPTARAAFDPVVLSSEPRWYAGDFHVHSEESGDAVATLDEIATLSRDRGLDFVALTDHNTTSHLPRIAAAQAAIDDFLFLRAAEVTTYGGHGNAIGISSYVDHRVGLDGVNASTIVADVVAQDAIFIVNHPTLDLGTACIGCAWSHADTPWESVSGIEILTGPYEIVIALFTPSALALWDEQLDAGHRIAAIGGSDDHRAGVGSSSTQAPIGSPTTLVYASSLSEAAIRDGVAAGRTIVKLRGPDDPDVDFTIGDAMIGDTVTGISTIPVHARVVGGDGMSLVIYRDGVATDTVDVVGDDFTADLDLDARGGLERLRLQLELANPVVVTSHIYVDGIAPSPDGGCCHGGPGNIAPGAFVFVALLRRRRRRRTLPTITATSASANERDDS
jgi:hypothetical protein